jgi:hypothetical protein
MKKEIQIVKKSILVVAILFAGALVAQAETPVSTGEKAEFVVVDVASLDGEVLTAIANECEGQGIVAINEILQCKVSQDFKIVGVNAEKEEIILLFDGNGKRKENKE